MNLQVYKDHDAFVKDILENDDMKELKVEVRKINWTIKKRDCQECHKPFETRYPAKIFCDNCADKVDKKNKSEAVIDRINKKIIKKNCVDCGNEFILSAPAMRKCEHCSTKGGIVTG